MILVIAEKPSVAQTIAAVLGAKEKKDGFLTGSGYIFATMSSDELKKAIKEILLR